MIVNTQIGAIGAQFDSFGNVCALFFALNNSRQCISNTQTHDAPGNQNERLLALELAEYFSGTRTKFTVPITTASSPFALRVRNALCSVGYGERISYSDLATRIGSPKATRAVAHAVATNPIPIIIPCHRVIRKDGTIGEYALHTLGKNGRRIKRYLLNLESN